MTRETITIEYDFDSLPIGFAWVATFRSYDGPESPIGTGRTPVEALEALLDMAGVEAIEDLGMKLEDGDGD